MAAFTEKLKADPTELSGRKVTGVVRTDGLKLILDDGSWVCYRLSGAEPVVRAYTEARSEHDMEALSAAAKNLFWRNRRSGDGCRTQTNLKSPKPSSCRC
jgi:phosphomannomutase